MAQYGYMPRGTTDALVIALAERLGIAKIATLDERHFRTVRQSHTCPTRSLRDRRNCTKPLVKDMFRGVPGEVQLLSRAP
jgi:hypothetical protein